MSNKINEIIQDIAIKHGVAIGKDDPVLILHTMNEKLLEENRKAQQELLTQFKEEMESIASQWKDDAKEKAEKIINAALAGGKEVMATMLQESTKGSVLTVKKVIEESLAEAHNIVQQARKYGWLLSSTTIAAFFLFFITNFY